MWTWVSQVIDSSHNNSVGINLVHSCDSSHSIDKSSVGDHNVALSEFGLNSQLCNCLEICIGTSYTSKFVFNTNVSSHPSAERFPMDIDVYFARK